VNAHTCPISSCTTDVEYGKLLCVPHWRMVPRPLQKALYRTWRGRYGSLSLAHTTAMQLCIRAVESKLQEVQHGDASV
jgi:hypothetical protein